MFDLNGILEMLIKQVMGNVDTEKFKEQGIALVQKMIRMAEAIDRIEAKLDASQTKPALSALPLDGAQDGTVDPILKESNHDHAGQQQRAANPTSSGPSDDSHRCACGQSTVCRGNGPECPADA